MDQEIQPTKWLWSPHNDRYQEWVGPQSHPEVAMDLWGLTGDQFQNSWGGLHHPDGTTQIGWWPVNAAEDESEAKRNAPLPLLKHLRKRLVNR